MTAVRVGKVREIWRYPVKGMGGERLTSGMLSADGIQGDRVWALRDEARAEIQSCKFRPELLLCTARLSEESGVVTVELPDGQRYVAGTPELDRALSEMVGHDSTLVALSGEADAVFFRRYKEGPVDWLSELKATFEREADEPLPDFSSLPPAVAEYVTLPGSFFLVAPLHLVTTATLDHLQRLSPDGSWDPRRFRPTLLIETEPEIRGLAEQEWLSKRIYIGEAAIDCTGTTPRCGAITRAQASLASDKSVLRTVVREADQNVGIYGQPIGEGVIQEGDFVYIEQP